jgi:hypothetical protein
MESASIDSDLEDEWVNSILKENKDYDDFYNEVNNMVSIFFIYVNKYNKIIFVKKEDSYIDEGMMSKLDLSLIIKKNSKIDNKKFSPISLLKYNIDLEPHNINNYINNINGFNFLTVEKNIKDLQWKDSITLFKDINSLYIIYYEKIKKTTNKNTKSIYFKKYKKNKTKKLKTT